MNKPLILACLALVFFTFQIPCATASAQEGAEEAPNWLQKALAREARRRGKKRKVSLLEGKLSGKMKAKTKIEPEEYDWGTYFIADIGSESAGVECYVYKESNETAKLLSFFSGLLIDNAAKANAATVFSKAIQTLSVDRVDDRPYMVTEWVYSLEQEDGQRSAGQAKVAAGLAGDVSVMCGHSELGYSNTFTSAFEELLGSIRFAEEPQAPYYKELYVMTLGEQDVGFFQNQVVLDADGDSEYSVIEATAMPVDAATLATSDSFLREWVRPDGSLINGHNVNIENGEVAMKLAFDPVDARTWQVTGQIQGKNYTTTLADVESIQSGLAQVQIIRDVIADAERQSGEMVAWVPDADPSALSRIVFTQNDTRRSGTLAFGPISMAVDIGKDGMVQTMGVDVGNGATMKIERVWFDGEVPEID